MKLADIISRLEGQVSDLRSVEGALAFTSLKDGAVKKSPAAFVLPGNERARPNALATGGIRQKVGTRFKILLAFSHSDASGGKSVDAFEDVRQALHTALIGWTPPGAQEPITYVGTQVIGLDAKRNQAWFDLEYATTTQISTFGATS